LDSTVAVHTNNLQLTLNKYPMKTENKQNASFLEYALSGKSSFSLQSYCF